MNRTKRIEKTPSLVRRFFKYTKRGNENDCWEWTGAKNALGYGRLSINRALGQVKAHRLSYLIYNGDPGDLHVIHQCDNPSCVNPFHLTLGTHAENMRDASVKGRWVGKGCGRKMPKGDANRGTKIKDEVIDDIRTLAAEGEMLQREIAVLFSISKSYVSQIASGVRRT